MKKISLFVMMTATFHFMWTLLLLCFLGCSQEAHAQYYDPYGSIKVDATVTHKEDPYARSARQHEEWMRQQEANRAREDAEHRDRMNEISRSSSEAKQRQWASQEAEKQRQHELELARIAAGNRTSSTSSSVVSSSGSSSTRSSAVSSSGSSSKKERNIVYYYGRYMDLKNNNIVTQDTIYLAAALDVNNWEFGLTDLDGNFLYGHPFTLKSKGSTKTNSGLTRYIMGIEEYENTFIMLYDPDEGRYISFGTSHESGEGWMFIIEKQRPR